MIEDNRKPSISGYLTSTKTEGWGDWCHSMHAYADPQGILCHVDSHQVQWLLSIPQSCLLPQGLSLPPDVNNAPGE